MLKIPSNRLSIANLTRSSRSRPIWSKDKSNQKNNWSRNPDTCHGDLSTMWNVFQVGAIITREDQVALLSSITGLDLCKVKNHRLSGRSFRTINLACLTRQALVLLRTILFRLVPSTNHQGHQYRLCPFHQLHLPHKPQPKHQLGETQTILHLLTTQLHRELSS